MAGVLFFTETVFKRIVFIATVMALSLMPMRTFGEEKKLTAVISADRLTLRTGPGTTATPLSVLEKGTSLTVLSSPDDEWIKVTDGDTIGYIINRKRYVNISEVEKFPRDPAALRQKADSLHQQISASKEKIRSYTQTESDMIQNLNKIELTLADTRNQLRDIDKKIQNIGQRINETETICQALKQQITDNERYASNRLKALYAITRLGSMNALAATGNLTTLFQQKTYMKRILTHDDRIRTKLIADKKKFANFLLELESGKKNELIMQGEYNCRLETLSREKARREDILSEIKTRRSLELAAVESRKQAALKLEQIIESFNTSVQQNSPSIDRFSSFRGLLKTPVRGKNKNLFGPYKHSSLNSNLFRSGIDIQAERGEPVTAVSAGRIIYSSWLKNYGNMIVIDHGDHYYTVYAHTEEMFKATGDRVDAGEVIATVGDSGSIDGAKLYFEIRHHGKALDPLKWIRHEDFPEITSAHH